MIVALLQENERNCNPPLPKDEVEGIAKSIAKYEPSAVSEDDSVLPEMHIALRASNYRIKDKCFYQQKIGKSGVEYHQICNFAAWIDSVNCLDDGNQIEHRYVISGLLFDGERLPPIKITSAELESSDWFINKWGHKVITFPGSRNKEHVKIAMQMLSFQSPKTHTFTHTGWKKLGDEWVYLHAGQDNGNNVVSLEFGLNRYNLDSDTTLDDAKDNVLKFFEVATPDIVFSLFGLVCLSFMRELLYQCNIKIDTVPFLVGTTGHGKSSLAALVLNFFGDFDTTSFPASFKDTPSALEKKMFILKDSLLLIDDYHPITNRQEAQKLDSLAQRIARLIGDGANRDRMRSTMEAQRSLPPRGLVLCTGEQKPQIGQSGQLRYTFIEVTREKMRYNEIYLPLWEEREALRKWSQIYLTWVKDNWQGLSQELRNIYRSLTESTSEEMPSGRPRKAITDLLFGVQLGLRFMKEQNWIDSEKESELATGAKTALVELGKQNLQEATIDNPVNLFIDLMNELLATNSVRIADSNSVSGDEQENIVGFLGDSNGTACLFPAKAYAAVQRLLREQNRNFPLTPTALWKQVGNAGLIFKQGKKRLEIQKRFNQKKVWVLVIKDDVFNVSKEPPELIDQPIRERATEDIPF